MDDAKTPVTNLRPVEASAVKTEQDDNSLELGAVLDMIDEIIQLKRQAKQSGRTDSRSTNTQAESPITNEERFSQLKKYRLLEELKKKFDGRVLFEYDEGLETLVKEVIV